ncbi:hypothetical protein SHKM778_51490 [Streptomyces sp. KM77-8]|uniref:Beta-glucosidase n=1 Tax=Streptomyces haneummycinicus TaxID=3074435 RepID=A0AAT9HML8_9ACTN
MNTARPDMDRYAWVSPGFPPGLVFGAATACCDRYFGVVRVDYDTQERTPKDSYHWYRRMIAAQRPWEPVRRITPGTPGRERAHPARGPAAGTP